MKTFLSAGMATVLLLPLATTNVHAEAPATTAPSAPTSIQTQVTLHSQDADAPSRVATNVYGASQQTVDTTPTTTVQQAAYSLDQLHISAPYGVAYFNNTVYVAKGNQGLDAVSLSTGTVTKVVYGTDLNIRAITVDSQGSLYYAIPDPQNPQQSYIKKWDANKLQRPTSAANVAQNSTTYAHIAATDISQLAMSPSNQLYLSIDKGWSYDPGILRWNESGQSLEVVSEEGAIITALAFDSKGNLYFKSSSSQEYYPFVAPGIIKISAAQLSGVLPADSSTMQSYKMDMSRTTNIANLLFLPDGKLYQTINNTITRVFPESRPIVSIDLDSMESVVQFGDTPVVSNLFIEDEEYSTFQTQITYSRDGKSIPAPDTTVPGVYMIHYTATNPAGISSLEVTQWVTVEPIPDKLTGWNIKGISAMDADSQNLYIGNNEVRNDPNHGLYKISLSSLQKTKLADIDDIEAVAVNANGDVFFSRSSIEGMFFKIEAKYLQSNKPLSTNELMQRSRTYTTFLSTNKNAPTQSVKGLDFDAQGRLYASVSVHEKTRSFSKIVRLSGTQWNQSVLITTLDMNAQDLEITKFGNLYINVFDPTDIATYKIASDQFKSLPVAQDKLIKLPFYKSGYGIVFLNDGTGYFSQIRDYISDQQTIFEFPSKDTP